MPANAKHFTLQMYCLGPTFLMCQHFYLPLQPSAGYPANLRQSTPSTLALPHGMALSACSLSEVAAVLSAVQVEGAKVTCHSFIGVRLLLPHAHIQISSVTP